MQMDYCRVRGYTGAVARWRTRRNTYQLERATMSECKLLTSVCVLICAFAGAVEAVDMEAVDIETVPVGNPGNAPDTRHPTLGCGAVSYAYRIGQYEVTAGQYTAFLNAVAGVDTYSLYNTSMWSAPLGFGCRIERFTGNGTSENPFQYRVAPDSANRPVNYVSWGDSARFANWLHNGQPTGSQNASTTEDGSYSLNGATNNSDLLAVTRNGDAGYVIPTGDEWYKAAHYKGGSTNAGYWEYPTRSDTAPGLDLTDATGNNANCGGDGYPIDSPYYTTVVGEFQNSESAYGTFDQGGNVWEWNETVLDVGYIVFRGLYGGAFNTPDRFLSASDERRGGEPSWEDGNIGFRIAYIPEPATLALLLLGCIAASQRRGR